jgi:superfamily II DNA or RNA helicase
MAYAVGSLVKARGREWVVLPESDEDLLVLRPLGGNDDEITGIYIPLEKVETAQFDLPDSSQLGDYRSCRLLRDALRLGFRSSAGPFRSFAKIAVEPRPYQLVPLLLALKLDPVRILIADDVGIGKTIEACLIARELIDRGEVNRFAVLCPPHLAEQWQDELHDKFHIEAELVLPSTASRLERDCGPNESLFERYPYVIVSTDFIKSERRRDEFLRTCPELVLVDEAHTCVDTGEGRGGRHQRYDLISGLAADVDRHMILITATPHSGKEEAFRSLLALLNPIFKDLPRDLAGKENENNRRRLAEYFIQRRRADIEHYMDTETPFPQRELYGNNGEETYSLSADYKKLFEKVISYAKETVKDPEGGDHHRRVRWWSALALLRSLASSPAAAVATLRNRASTADTETASEADEIGRRTVLDLSEDESFEGMDLIPGSDTGGEDDKGKQNRHRLLAMAREAEDLQGKNDNKLQKAIKLVESLLRDGYNPILFCRFIPTAEYVANALRSKLPNNVEVVAVTGTLPPTERENRVMQLKENEDKKRILVATDCLSEGVNLQELFDAVIHYDLSWNPTRHEQREGRVDRYGQPSNKVRVLTYYGIDNQIDGIVLDVLLRKHKSIRNALGISVPVPADSDHLIEAIFEGLLLKESAGSPDSAQLLLPGFEEFLRPQKEDLFQKWDIATEQEKRSRTMFAQETIKAEDVAQELQAAKNAIGSSIDIKSFLKDAIRAFGGVITDNGAFNVDLTEAAQSLRDIISYSNVSVNNKFKARFDPVSKRQGEIHLTRTHPFVEGVAAHVLDTALDAIGGSIAKRCGVIRTSLVKSRTVVLLMRYRYHILVNKAGIEKPLLAEDCELLAFEGSPSNANWLEKEHIEGLLQAIPEANLSADQAVNFISRVINDFDHIRPHINQAAEKHGDKLLEAHKRVRTASRVKGVSYSIKAQLPPDVLGLYIYLPKEA